MAIKGHTIDYPSRDHLPEYTHYHDTGCSLFPACLRCPMPCCRYDATPTGQRPTTALRNRRVAAAHARSGQTTAELAAIFGVTQRTIQRALKASHNDTRRN